MVVNGISKDLNGIAEEGVGVMEMRSRLPGMDAFSFLPDAWWDSTFVGAFPFSGQAVFLALRDTHVKNPNPASHFSKFSYKTFVANLRSVQDRRYQGITVPEYTLPTSLFARLLLSVEFPTRQTPILGLWARC